MAAGTSGQATEAADWTPVYLVRHGQTPLNESGVLRGLLDPPLDEAGHLQAGRLGAVLGPRMPPSSSPARCCGPGRPHSRSPTVPVAT
jgi:Histidine phosphatase superfamily (branch 1)